ncbi:MAG: hypothetical protein QXI32_06505 [Candidatus Bathyarchaeia archaeon]
MQINKKNVKTLLTLYLIWVVADTVSLILFLPLIFESGVEANLVDISLGWARALIPPPLNFALDLETGPEFFVLQLVIASILCYWFFLRNKLRLRAL